MTQVNFPEAFRFLFSDKADDGNPVRYRAAFGGRGSAKSHSVATALILGAAKEPLRVLCAREVQKSIRDSVKRLLDDKIQSCGLAKFYTSTDSEIRGANGSLFVFAGLRGNADGIRSLEGIDRAWVEEASTVSLGSLDTLIPTIRRPGSELLFTWNPRNETDPVDQMFRGPKGAPPGSIVREVNYAENPWFPEVLRREVEYDQHRDPDKYAHVWLGQYLRNSSARVFRNWRVEDFETPYDAEFRFGADWGFAEDPTALLRGFLKGRTLYFDYEAYEVGCEIDDTPALFETIPGAKSWLITADSARPETISYMARREFNIRKATKGPGSVEEGVQFLKSFDIVVHPRCRHLIDELSLYSYKVDKLTEEVMPVLAPGNDHLIDCARYALESLRRASPMFAYEEAFEPNFVGRNKVSGY